MFQYIHYILGLFLPVVYENNCQTSKLIRVCVVLHEGNKKEPMDQAPYHPLLTHPVVDCVRDDARA
jgi:hypothetical protein